MFEFLAGLVVGGLGLYLILDNNPKLAAKLKVVKEVVESKIKKEI